MRTILGPEAPSGGGYVWGGGGGKGGGGGLLLRCTAVLIHHWGKGHGHRLIDQQDPDLIPDLLSPASCVCRGGGGGIPPPLIPPFGDCGGLGPVTGGGGGKAAASPPPSQGPHVWDRGGRRSGPSGTILRPGGGGEGGCAGRPGEGVDCERRSTFLVFALRRVGRGRVRAASHAQCRIGAWALRKVERAGERTCRARGWGTSPPGGARAASVVTDAAPSSTPIRDFEARNSRFGSQCLRTQRQTAPSPCAPEQCPRPPTHIVGPPKRRKGLDAWTPRYPFPEATGACQRRGEFRRRLPRVGYLPSSQSCFFS